MFTPPITAPPTGLHHASAAAGNAHATSQAIGALRATLSNEAEFKRVLLKAAAGAGKSYALCGMVADALAHPRCGRVGVTAFANKQLYPLAEQLGRQFGNSQVCLRISPERVAQLPPGVFEVATVATDNNSVPATAAVVIATSHMFGYTGRTLQSLVGTGANGEALFDVLFVDEAWQLPLHLYRDVDRLAPVVVGVGDVGQLPPLDPGQNPWRGDRVYNPYRAWPTAYDRDDATWSVELPAVWRPTQAQLGLWRAFYGDWDNLHCICGPGDRRFSPHNLSGVAADVWAQVGTGVPTLVEVDNLDPPEAADIDRPLLAVVEGWLDELLAGGFTLHHKTYDDAGQPREDVAVESGDPDNGTLIAVLATRNQAVDDAEAMVERLVVKHGLPQGVLIASTVDSWQGQTNALTVAIHPLSGASRLDAFNAAFGRLAVTCTRATHGLLMVSRAGLGDLLATSPARPGTPLGEPGTRRLPRQTHQRILATFARGTHVP